MDTAIPPTPGETTGTPEAPPPGRFAAFKQRHHLAFEVVFFFGGFLFDVLLLHRIDSTPLLIHQATYLCLSALLIAWDHRLTVAGKEPSGWFGKLASYRLWAMHFFLGTLLNAFLVFYFRASSGFFSLVFLGGLAALIVANELPAFRGRGPVVRVAMLSFAVTSFLAYLLPVVWGALASWHYFAAVAVGAGVTVGLWQLFRVLTRDPKWTFPRACAPGLAIQLTLLLLYVAEAIPPVPLSLKHIGIYTAVTAERSERGLHYRLTSEPEPAWQRWAHLKPTLVGPSGTRAYAFVRVFAPAKFRDEVAFVWEFDDPERGWVERGKPFVAQLTGGNETGFRTFAYSTMGKAGTYRVRVVTEDGREIGRQSFMYEPGEARATEDEVD